MTKEAVIKIADASNLDIENEAYALKELKRVGIAPELHTFFITKGNRILAMSYRKGENGQSILDSGDVNKTLTLYASLGHALATKVHIHTFQEKRTSIRTCQLENVDYNIPYVPTSIISTVKNKLTNLHDSEKDWVLTHGDYGVHNVLYTEDRQLTVVDWEWAEWANPLMDIGWVYCFTHLHYPSVAKELTHAFISAYNKHAAIDLCPEKVKAYIVYKVWTVVTKVKTAPSTVQQEWIKRLHWTLALPFDLK